jgi:hypothetical protein
MSRSNYTIPYRESNKPIRTGPTAGKMIEGKDFGRLLDIYY